MYKTHYYYFEEDEVKILCSLLCLLRWCCLEMDEGLVLYRSWVLQLLPRDAISMLSFFLHSPLLGGLYGQREQMPGREQRGGEVGL